MGDCPYSDSSFLVKYVNMKVGDPTTDAYEFKYPLDGSLNLKPLTTEIVDENGLTYGAMVATDLPGVVAT